MATQRSEKKRKSGLKKRLTVNLKKKKNLSEPKLPKKKMIKKPEKKPVRKKGPAKAPVVKAPKDGREGTRKLLLAMRDKLIHDFSETRVP